MEASHRSEFLDYFAKIRGRTEAVVRCIPREHLEWGPGPRQFTLGDIVRHLASIERYMYAENACRRPSRYPGHGRELADGFDDVLAYFDRAHAESMAIFTGLTEPDYEAPCRTPAGVEIRVWKWLRAMVEHEAHHRGQLYLYLGLLGAATPPIFGLTSEQVRAASADEDAPN